MIPGGKFAYAVASAAWTKYREKKKDAEALAEVQKLAAARLRPSAKRWPTSPV